MYLVNFATGGFYREIQQRQHGLLSPYVQGIFEFNDDVLRQTDWYTRNKTMIEESYTGWGYASWKATILLDVFRVTHFGDLIFYSDVSDEIYNPEFFSWATSRTIDLGGHFFNLNYYNHGEWTKRDCFVEMDCDTPEYWNHRQLEAGTIILENNLENKILLNDWKFWCEDYTALDKHPNKLGKDNLPGYKDHRTDQSILTNLVIKRDWKTEYMENIRAYIKYNAFDNVLDYDKHTVRR